MRPIDADALLEKIDTEREILVKDGRLGTEHILVHCVREFVETAPTVDIVLCKECMYYNGETHGCKRNPSVMPWEENDFCSYGEKL